METQTLDIPVIWPDYFEDCEQCIERLRETLGQLDGVHSVTVNTDRRALRLTYEKDVLTFEEIKEHARLLGVNVAERYKHEIIQIAGLDCPDCAMKLETAIMRLKGVAWATLSYATSMLVVEFEPQVIGLPDIYKRVRGFGYDVQEAGPAGAPPKKTVLIRNTRMALTVISGALLAVGLALRLAMGDQVVSPWIFIASAVTGGVFAARSGILSLKAFSLDTNFLMTAAAVGALALGDYSEAAAVMFLFSLGSTLEAHTVDKTRRSLKSLVEAFPTHAAVRRDGRIEDTRLEEVEIGDIVLIKPGEKVPVDGTVVEGESAVDEAPITGESVPKGKSLGDSVYAGSINGRGALEVRTTTTSEDNTLARIVHMVEEANAQKAPSQRFAEKFGRYYTPTVIGLAALIAIAGPIVTGSPFSDWLTRALTLLVVSCPCALVISTPVAIVAAIGNAARSGILIKGGAHLEALGEVSVVAFDKTGTLTVGKPSVTQIVPLNSHTPEEVLSVAASVESRSEHPLATAVLDKAREMGLPEYPVAFFEAFPGKGARAVVNGGVFYVGGRRLIEEIGISIPNTPTVDSLLASGSTVIYVADETTVWGAITANDTLKPGTANAILRLRDAGIARTMMLTGDTRQTAGAVCENLGLDGHCAELLPEDKLAQIRELAARYGRVAMVGDGINDAPALAAADVGIAMGGAGNHAAIEAADVALMADDIAMLPYAVSLSRRAKRIIRQNVAIALLAVLVLVGGALLKWISLATGVLGHEGSALLVIANSMRLLKMPRKCRNQNITKNDIDYCPK
ncbi:MAG: cadmium-translocating P-type ATPase [Armatimonadetes bacterium]|nr:cadmium-translocating P-type ATPase [Armatimonadota bacterium]